MRTVIAVLLKLLPLVIGPQAPRVNNCAHDPIGDVNQDGAVDILDFSALATAYGKSAGQPGYNVAADLDCSGTVDNWDYQIFQLGYALWRR